MPPPTEDHWKRIEYGFRTRWNFPNCVGALDGKHVALRKPANTGSLYFNYKSHFSVVLMALVDHQYRFTYIDVGNYGSNSDPGIFRNSTFGDIFLKGKVNIPGRKMLPDFPQAGLLPHCIVGDKAFPLRVDLMKPYSRPNKNNPHRGIPEDKLVFNYRLSRARRIVENAFGILVQRWCVFDRRIALNDNNAIKLIQARSILHNYLTSVDTDPQQVMARLNPMGREYNKETGALRNQRPRGIRSPNDAEEVRDWYKTYFWSPLGATTWQMDHINYM